MKTEHEEYRNFELEELKKKVDELDKKIQQIEKELVLIRLMLRGHTNNIIKIARGLPSS